MSILSILNISNILIILNIKNILSILLTLKGHIKNKHYIHMILYTIYNCKLSKKASLTLRMKSKHLQITLHMLNFGKDLGERGAANQTY